MKTKRENRLPKFKDCKHRYRFLRRYKGYYVYYCVKCLIYSIKDPDFTFKEWVKEIKKHEM